MTTRSRTWMCIYALKVMQYRRTSTTRCIAGWGGRLSMFSYIRLDLHLGRMFLLLPLIPACLLKVLNPFEKVCQNFPGKGEHCFTGKQKVWKIHLCLNSAFFLKRALLCLSFQDDMVYLNLNFGRFFSPVSCKTKIIWKLLDILMPHVQKINIRQCLSVAGKCKGLHSSTENINSCNSSKYYIETKKHNCHSNNNLA